VPAPAVVVAASPSASIGAPAACGTAWKLDLAGGDARAVVVCPNDVQRQAFDESSVIARALSPALGPARDRVCGCADRVSAPPFVDLVFTARPEEGQVTVKAGDEDLDPDLGAAFVACVGVLVATFAPIPSNACAGAGKASFVFPVRLDLARGSPTGEERQP
jgi:hypothetical protein